MRRLKNAFGVIPWLDHGIQKKTIKNTNNVSIFNWIPRLDRGMTTEKPIHVIIPCERLKGAWQSRK
ncbi:hypothetical protein [Rickettsia helvetica]|uniref:hypothetical protein n=1 Tax=Rickettsia helvetica TaxID=35789 RepID=UPI00397C5128